MNSFLQTDLPTVYADMNVFRYLACGDISIFEPERFHWVYSHVHLDEIHRNGNKDALEGMKMLGALEVTDVLNEEFQSVGNILLNGYVDPFERYEQHLEAISGFEGVGEHVIEHLIRSFGADNFSALSKTPDQMVAEVERLTSGVTGERKEKILSKANAVSKEMTDSIDTHMKGRRPIDTSRKAMGITSEDRKTAESAECPISAIWELVSPAVNGQVTKNQFFGFEPIPGIESVQHTQEDAISGSYIVLNMLGLASDRGMSKREKVKNAISDGQHVGMASYCNALLSADLRLCNKAQAIFTYLENVTNALHFEYKKGLEVSLGVG